MDRLWALIPIGITTFAGTFIGWVLYELRLSWVRNDSWGFTVTVAAVVIPIFLTFIWLAADVLWGIAAEGVATARARRRHPESRP